MMRKILFILIMIFGLAIYSCSKEDEQDYTSIEIYGHGGAGFESFMNTIPPNSFESIQKAIEVLSADGVEVDVQIDNNGKLWLYHDEILDTKTNCTGCLGDQSSEYIGGCDYSGKRSIFSLDELISYSSSMDPKPKISIQAQVYKRCRDYSELGNALFETINSNNAYNWVQIESDSKELLIMLRDSSNQLQLFLDGSDVQSDISFCASNGLNGIIMFNNNVSVQDVEDIKASGLKIGLYGIKDQWQTKDALNKYPDQIQTENIELMNRIIFD